jgi:hypothetical protein
VSVDLNQQLFSRVVQQLIVNGFFFTCQLSIVVVFRIIQFIFKLQFVFIGWQFITIRFRSNRIFIIWHSWCEWLWITRFTIWQWHAWINRFYFFLFRFRYWWQ